jgi:hypothetical protein
VCAILTQPEFWIWNLYISFLLAVSVVEAYFLKYCFASTGSMFWIFISVVRYQFPSFLFSSDLIAGYLNFTYFWFFRHAQRSTVNMDWRSWPFLQIPFYFHFSCLKSVSFHRIHDKFGFSLFSSDKQSVWIDEAGLGRRNLLKDHQTLMRHRVPIKQNRSVPLFS